MTLSLPGRATREPAVLAAVALLVAVLLGFVFLLSPLLALAGSTAVLLFSVGLRYPDVATYAVLFLLYSNLPVVAAHFHGVPKLAAVAYPLLLGMPFVQQVVLDRKPLVLTPVL